MKHKVRVTVLKKNLYPELQQAYCADPHAGPCLCYHEGDVFEFYRDGSRDDFWHMGANTLVRTKGDPNTVAGGPQLPFCSEAVSYTHLDVYKRQGPGRKRGPLSALR